MSNIDNMQLINQSKLIHIKEQFEKFFLIKGYPQNSQFDNKVWFLKADEKFQSTRTNQTPNVDGLNTKKTIVLDIIRDLNKGQTFDDLKVPVDSFIDRISKTINDANISIQISDDSIMKNNSHEKISKINEMLTLLTSRIKGKKSTDFSSKLTASVLSLNNIPSGTYKVQLKLNTSFDSENLNELNESEKKNNNRNTIESVFNLFQEETLQTKSLITIPKDNNSVTFRANHPANKNENNSFSREYEFKILDKLGENYLVDKRYSGTSLANFKVVLRKESEVYESKNEYFLHLILSWVDELCNITKELISKTLYMKIYGGKETNEKGVKLQMDFEIDDLTRYGMLSRIRELISIPVETKMKKSMIIEEILSVNFPELKDSIKNILNKKEEVRDECCGCIIF